MFDFFFDFPEKIFPVLKISRFLQYVKFQLKSEQGWIFFMQKLQLNSGQELCTVNMIWNSSIKSSNFTVNKGKYKDRIMFHTESYNFTVDKATENWHVVDFLLFVQVAFCAIIFISFVHLVPEKEALAIRLFFFSLIVHQ